MFKDAFFQILVLICLLIKSWVSDISELSLIQVICNTNLALVLNKFWQRQKPVRNFLRERSNKKKSRKICKMINILPIKNCIVRVDFAWKIAAYKGMFSNYIIQMLVILDPFPLETSSIIFEDTPPFPDVTYN